MGTRRTVAAGREAALAAIDATDISGTTTAAEAESRLFTAAWVAWYRIAPTQDMRHKRSWGIAWERYFSPAVDRRIVGAHGGAVRGA